MTTEEGPWISLPSKHHPDETYYFNVTTGESTWEKPECYSEPVDDSTNLQCIAKPSTPERTGTCSYIVESLSPSTSPRKRYNDSSPISEKFRKGESEDKNERIIPRKKFKIKDHPYQSDRNIQRNLMKDNVIEVHFRYNESTSKTDPRKVVNKPLSKDGTSYVTNVERFRSSDYKFYNLPTKQRSTQVDRSSGKLISKKMTENNNYMASYPSFSRSGNQFTSNRNKLSETQGVYGSASLRLERLKKQLAEEQIRKYQQPKSEWPENSSKKECQIQLFKQRNSVGDEIRTSDMCSYIPVSSDSRYNYLLRSGNELHKLTNVDTIPYSSETSIMGSRQLGFKPEYDKPYFIRDYNHTRYSKESTLSKTKYCKPALETDVAKHSLQSSLLLETESRKFGTRECYQLSNFDKKFLSHAQSPGSVLQTCDSALLQKYNLTSKKQESKLLGIRDKDFLSHCETELFLKPGIYSLPRKSSFGQLTRYHQFSENATINKVRSEDDRIHNLKTDRSSITNTELHCISKTPANDRLRDYKHSLPQTGQRNQFPGIRDDLLHRTRLVVDSVCSLESGRSSFTGTEFPYLSKTPSLDHLRNNRDAPFGANMRSQHPGNKLLHDSLNKTGSVENRVCSSESARCSAPVRVFTHVSKTPTMDQSKDYKQMILQANTQRNQHCGNNLSLRLTNSNIEPFASTSDAFHIGKRNDKNLRTMRTDSSNDVIRKPVEHISHDAMPLLYSKSSKNIVEDFEPKSKIFRSNEAVQGSVDWIPRGIVRDYNHKRIVGDSKQQSSNISSNNMKFIDKKSVANNHMKMEPVSKEIGSRRKGYEQLLFYHQKSSENTEIKVMSDIPRRDLRLGIMGGKSFGPQEKEYERRENSKISVEDRLRLNYVPSDDSFSNSGYTKGISSKSELTQQKMKQKSRESKGGITKISRKVQKQLRTAASKFIHLPTFDIQKNVHRSEDQLVQNKSDDSIKNDDEVMDWEPIEPEKVVMHVEALRKEGGFQNSVNPDLINLCNMDAEVLTQWFVVLDTNVLLSHLNFISSLRDINDNELGMPTLIIPWIVLKELDNLKSSNRKIPLQFQARKAINFLYDNLSARHPRVRGQSKAESDEHADLEPDDSILQCSLNLLKYSDKLLLLTNDHNLFNKAIVNGVQCCSAAKLVQDLESRHSMTSTASVSSSSAPECTYPLYHATVQTAKQCIGVVLEEVLRTEMVLVYDRKWSEIIGKKPPWTLNDILFCLLKHWIAVFQLVLPSEAKKLIEEIRLFVNDEKYEDSFEKVENFIKACISLMQFVSSLSYKEYVDKTLKTLKELQQTLREQVKLSTSVSASNTSHVDEKVNDSLSSMSSIAQPSASASVSDVSFKGVHHSNSSGSCVANSRNGTKNNIGGPKVDVEDDYLSLFASSISEDVLNNNPSDNSIKRAQELAHKYLNKIWEEVAAFCGMLCDVMGVNPCVPYQAPEPLPTIGTLQHNVLPYVTCVCTIIRCMEGILSIEPNELKEDNPAIVNFYAAIKEYLPAWNEHEEVLLPRHVLIYCTQSDTREQLECGRKQFEQFEAVLNQAVKFFLRQIQGNTSLPHFK